MTERRNPSQISSWVFMSLCWQPHTPAPPQSRPGNSACRNWHRYCKGRCHIKIIQPVVAAAYHWRAAEWELRLSRANAAEDSTHNHTPWSLWERKGITVINEVTLNVLNNSLFLFSMKTAATVVCMHQCLLSLNSHYISLALKTREKRSTAVGGSCVPWGWLPYANKLNIEAEDEEEEEEEEAVRGLCLSVT